jgi:hypothetical protein
VRLGSRHRRGESTHVIDLAPRSFVGVPVTRVKLAKNHSAKALTKSAVGLPVVVDLSAARGDVEAEEILHGGQVWGVNALVETALPGAGLAGGCKALLDVFIHYF